VDVTRPEMIARYVENTPDLRSSQIERRTGTKHPTTRLPSEHTNRIVKTGNVTKLGRMRTKENQIVQQA
jgi:hypothetical protein